MTKTTTMPLIKKQSFSLACGHTVCVPYSVVKNITKDTQCINCIKTGITVYGKNKSV